MVHTAALVIDQLPPMPEKPTLHQRLSEAVPDKPWTCVTAGLNFSIQLVDAVDSAAAVVAPPEEQPDHGDREHADLGASSCYRWWNCPGCLNLTKKLNPPKRTSPDAELGTAAHEVGHYCLLSHQDAIEMVNRVFNNIVIDEKTAHNVQKYLDLCRSFMGPDSECWTERKFNLKKLKPPGPMFGTSDFSALLRKESMLVIIDYKNGFLPVPATSPQLKYYLLGVLCALPEDTKIDKIKVFIVQPNGKGQDIKECEYTVSEIFAWHLDLLQHARATQDPAAPLHAGDWCKFCPNSGLCPVEADKNMETAQLTFSAEYPPGALVVADQPAPVNVTFTALDVSAMTPEHVGALMLKFSEARNFMNSVEEMGAALIANGTDVPYWKLIQGLGIRRWKAPADTAKVLTDTYGLTEDQVWTKKLLSPATLEDILRPMLRTMGIKGKRADEMLVQAIGPLTVRPDTAPRLVRDTDPAPALARGEDFTAEYPPENVKL